MSVFLAMVRECSPDSDCEFFFFRHWTMTYQRLTLGPFGDVTREQNAKDLVTILREKQINNFTL